MPVKVGDKAPDFTLTTKTSDGLKPVKLSDLFGKQNTVLLFFRWCTPVFAPRKCAT